MPCEILQCVYFGHDDSSSFVPFHLDIASNAAPPPPRIPVLHNYLHDLEAIYWTGLWIITSRVNHEPSLTWGLKIFRHTLTLPPERLQAFILSIRHVLDEICHIKVGKGADVWVVHRLTGCCGDCVPYLCDIYFTGLPDELYVGVLPDDVQTCG